MAAATQILKPPDLQSPAQNGTALVTVDGVGLWELGLNPTGDSDASCPLMPPDISGSVMRRKDRSRSRKQLIPGSTCSLGPLVDE